MLITPTRADLVDGGLLLVLGMLALVGFRTTFTGWTYFIAGVLGLLIGIVIAHFANVLGQPVIALAAMTIAVFFLLGGAVALRHQAVGGVLPSGATLRSLADQSVRGWKELLTTLPPVDGSGPLLVLPYLLGLLTGVGGYCLARRTRPSFAPVGPPFAMMIAVILLGLQTPSARLLQGATFIVIALGWAALRSQRLRPAVQTGSGRATRMATALTLLTLAATGAVLVGPHLPGVGSHRRTVLRSYVEPPSNIDQYPSPLAGFRKYKRPPTKSQVLFTVNPAINQPIRIATLDDYNDYVWTASNSPASVGAVPDSFQRVGARIATAESGKPVTYTITISSNGNGYSDVWLPDVGEMTRIQFHGPRAAEHAKYLRYNLATGTAVLPDGLHSGDSYTVRAIVPRDELSPRDAVGSADPTSSGEAGFLTAEATRMAGTATTPMNQVKNIEQALREGYYSDGLVQGQRQYLPGHYEAQMKRFLDNPEIVGDDEQYAAAFALLLNSSSIGIPARVVLGATPVKGVVTGNDIHAWVEVQLVDGSWRTIPTTDFTPPKNKAPHQLPKQQQAQVPGQQVPPPAATRPRSDQAVDSAVGSASSSRRHHAILRKKEEAHLPRWIVATATWAGPPVLLVALVCALIIGYKAARRRRRRVRGSPAIRLARGWHEILDHARDLGAVLPGGRTRREQAAVLAEHDIGGLARTADAHVFGAADPLDADAVAYWQQVDAARRQMKSNASRWRRVRAAISVSSLRPVRATGEAGTL